MNQFIILAEWLLMIYEIEQFKYKLRSSLNLLGAIAALFFGVLQTLRGDLATAAISFMGLMYFILVIYYLIVQKKYLCNGRGFVLFIPITMLSVIYAHPEYGIYWAYVGIISFFLALEHKDASISVTIFIAIIFYFVSGLYPFAVQLRIYVTLLLVAIFSFLLSYLINRLLAEVNSLVIRDPLTNAFNRHTFIASIEQAINTHVRYKTPVTLFIFDLDKFKGINDAFGHQAGDKVLKKVSRTIQGRLRESDQLFRYGGEEFAVLLNHTGLADAQLLADELRQLVEQQVYDIGRSVTISGGVSEVVASDNLSSWVERCDKALYRAKSSGRNRIVGNSAEEARLSK